MQNFLFLFNDWWYILILMGVMVLSGVIKRNNLFGTFYNFLIRKVKNKKLLVVLVSFFGGILPVPGRVIVSAGLLDTIASDDPAKRSKFGIIDYLATHHYYLWSPLEKTILIPMAVLKISYLEMLSYTWPLLVVSLLVLIVYILMLKPGDIEVRDVNKVSKCNITYKPWYQFINWKIIGFVFCVIVAGNFIKESGGTIKNYIEMISNNFNGSIITFIWISIVAFLGSLAMGSSSKFAGIAALLTSIFGLPYLTYIFAIEYAGYLLSPMHKCVAIGMSYFGTPLKKYYAVLLLWSVLLIITGILTLFI